ncbi:MAG: NnrS family protein [Steroidobacteraceae bacterium]
MSDVTETRSGLPGFALFSYGFRPFFLAAGIWGAVAIALWIAMLTRGLELPSRFDPLTWHVHEMLFGFVLAAVAGFLLTAIPNWTGRRPVAGAPLAILAGLWTLGRVAVLVSAWMPPWLAVAADVAFPIALAAVVAREIILSGNRRNMPMIAPVAVLAIADLLTDSSIEGWGSLSGYGWRLGLTAILILISVVGGRMVPSFTRNWMVARRRVRLPAAGGAIDRVSLGLLHASLLAWVLAPGARPVGIALLCASGMNLWRLVRWRGAETRAEPLLLVLHVGYAWLVIGVGALGVSLLDSAFALSAAIHALTAGAVGTMILAVMTRATRGHTGRELRADGATTLIYALVILAAAVRVSAALVERARADLLLVAAVLWVGAFGLFALCYAPLMLRPRSIQ